MKTGNNLSRHHCYKELQQSSLSNVGEIIWNKRNDGKCVNKFFFFLKEVTKQKI